MGAVEDIVAFGYKDFASKTVVHSTQLNPNEKTRVVFFVLTFPLFQ